uniref:Photosystem II 12 kDa extrinsic protein n=1 Tax=Helicotheca tamesis TaxID=374047 RepID=A0A7S2GXA3_9STRA|mmetsp:Transcript_13007/g.17891  ORF Transcript_13007/g.17891 Transcript_13007/m.17891 type:complete len:151 (+) Transcript_13007:91-543(+)|eukprot:CAMPEP_0185725556 /NCGR_PEP_ID=MMETSP1171-20130828/1779_1 /TAXON_ID=374046 /ORGANISM="Helicotheca tamensis, Strain CCMP826" /LENGTH=150 /DNA_ID=CAMNT_0028393709 /DNA_START=40 /DNA_END=492 /DNA_ORIENTATION=-
MKLAILAALVSAAAAFTAPQTVQQSTALNAEAGRREFFGSAAAAAIGAFGVAAPASAVVDYENIGYLGGSSIVDLNNANVRVYLKMPGMYPTVAGKIVSNGPYASVSDVYNIKGLTSGEKEILKKYESRFTAKAPSADYVIDRINNGLYR